MFRRFLLAAAVMGLSLGAFVRPGTADEPKKDEKGQRPFLGVALMGEEGKVIVQDVIPDGPAAKAGLQKDDVITRVGKTDVKSPQDVIKTLQKAKPGDKIEVHFQRDDKEKTVTVTLGRRPAAGS